MSPTRSPHSRGARASRRRPRVSVSSIPSPSKAFAERAASRATENWRRSELARLFAPRAGVRGLGFPLLGDTPSGIGESEEERDRKEEDQQQRAVRAAGAERANAGVADRGDTGALGQDRARVCRGPLLLRLGALAGRDCGSRGRQRGDLRGRNDRYRGGSSSSPGGITASAVGSGQEKRGNNRGAVARPAPMSRPAPALRRSAPPPRVSRRASQPFPALCRSASTYADLNRSDRSLNRGGWTGKPLDGERSGVIGRRSARSRASRAPGWSA